MPLPTNTNKEALKRQAAKPEGYKELRKQYTRLRDAEVKRVKRAQEAGYLKQGVYIPTLSEIGKEPADLVKEYARLSKLIENKSTRISGLREEASKRVKSFNDLGYDFVTEKNEKQFGEFMGYMIQKYSENTPDGKKLLLDSDIIVEGFDYVHERTNSSNHSTISRLFNQFLREEGLL